MNIGCSKPSTSTNEVKEVKEISTKEYLKEEKKNMIMVGKPAPTFKAPAFHKGEFTEVNLEDYKGKWVLLCFYPGDFTFV